MEGSTRTGGTTAAGQLSRAQHGAAGAPKFDVAQH